MTNRAFLPKSRVEAFSDGVIAIIVTILVLEVKVPALTGPDVDQPMRGALWHALPLIAAYVVSFLVVLVFWVAHHHLLHSMKQVDRNFLWLNGLFLLVLAFVPAPTALLGEYPRAPTATIAYGVILAASGLAFAVMRMYVTRHGALLHDSVPREVARTAMRRSLLSPALYGIGASLALVDTRIAWLVYLGVPLIFIVPSAFERHAHALDE